MAVKINKPWVSAKKTVKLSQTGLIIIIVLIVVLFWTGIIIMGNIPVRYHQDKITINTTASQNARTEEDSSINNFFDNVSSLPTMIRNASEKP